MTDLMVEVLDFNWVRKAITGQVISASITDELGQVGEANVVLPGDDPIRDSLPEPDANNPYEGRFRIYEDDVMTFAGVIDAKTVDLDESDNTISFTGKQRGIELGFYNTGRVDYIGWDVAEFFEEMLRDNIAKQATIEDISSEDDLYPGFQALTGDPFKQNYWKSTSGTPNHWMIIDLGDDYDISAIRVMPQWWKDPDTKKFHFHSFEVAVSSDNSSYTTVYTKGTDNPSSGKGHLYEGNHNCRYVKLTVTDSSDGYARIAQVMVYRQVATKGSDTTYVTPFIENDDSGNVDRAGSTTRPVIPGAFQGDSVITRSYVTRLGSGGSVTQTFRGVSSSVFFTSAKSGGASHVNIYVDNNLRVSNLLIPGGKYWFKAYDTLEDFGGLLSDAKHTLKVEQVDGSPQIDYFSGLYRTSWRPIEDDDNSIAYKGSWSAVQAPYYYNYFAAKSDTVGDELQYSFRGDRIRVIGSEPSGGGTFHVTMDGTSDGDYSTAGGGLHKQVLYEWNGSYADHKLNLRNTDGGPIYIDRLEGNFRHTLYLRSRYETNLKMLIRMSEILDSYCRFNDDGSVDLLGSVGESSGSIIREGENEGGEIIKATREHDYRETGSVCLAIVNVNGELPIKAMVIDHEALAEIGWKVVKLEQSDAADQFLLNRQALNFLRDHRKPNKSYDISYDGDEIPVGETVRLYSPSAGLDGSEFRIGKITTEYVT
jgi:hypothetical protein